MEIPGKVNLSYRGGCLKIKILIALFGLTASLQAGAILYSGSMSQYIVPVTGIYQVVAFGAAGGASGALLSGTGLGGDGAEIGGDFTLLAGEILDLYIGGQGGPGEYAGGGGGGTFVVTATGTLLLAAGGGGGGYGSINGLNANTGTFGGGSNGGTNGNGGGALPDGDHGGGGGGGYLSVGIAAAAGCPDVGGGAFPGLAGGTDGETGYTYTLDAGSGGYGGGGGGCFSDGAGGGGGFSGGGGGDSPDLSLFSVGEGGGGGSSWDPSITNLMTSPTGRFDNNGVVTIDLESEGTPEPPPLVFVAIGLATMAVMRRARTLNSISPFRRRIARGPEPARVNLARACFHDGNAALMR